MKKISNEWLKAFDKDIVAILSSERLELEKPQFLLFRQKEKSLL